VASVLRTPIEHRNNRAALASRHDIPAARPVKTKTQVRLLVLAMLLVGGLAAWWFGRGDRAPAPAVAATPARPPAPGPAQAARPAQTRPAADPGDTDGVIDGRVINGLSHDGVPDAELTFVGEGVESTFRTSSDGSFELTPTVTGSFALSTITAPGYLPYAPELGTGSSGMRVTLARGRSVHGVTLVLYPAVDRQGRVIDGRGAPVPGARIRVLANHPGEHVPDSLATEWRSGSDGQFTFQAADDSVLEASHGNLRGWGRVDRFLAIQGKLTIQLGRGLPRDATITGRVRDTRGAPIADALVRAYPASYYGGVPTVFAASDADGAFTLASVDRAAYDVAAEAEDHVRAVRVNVLGGSRSVELTLETGLPLAGRVVDASGAPVAVFTLVAMRRAGSARPVLANQSLVDPQGRFALRVPPGDYDLLVSARGWARSTQARATAGATDVRIVLGSGATLRGRVVARDDRTPIGNASVACDGPRDRGRALSADAGAVTRPDGTFELAGISAGPLAIRIGADGYHSRIEGLPAASDGAMLGPITVELTRVAPDESSRTEVVGIGVDFLPDGEALRVTRVLPGSGAFDAGIGFGDRVIAVDGSPVGPLGVEGTIARIRGIAGTTVTVTLQRDGRDVQLVVERRLLRA
jgi:hypothetical protein